jgi:hypothetical protein
MAAPCQALTYLDNTPAVVDIMAKEVFGDPGIAIDQNGEDDENHGAISEILLAEEDVKSPWSEISGCNVC